MEGQKIDKDLITVVSGLPRSGTSMMMKMLVAGGMEAMTDNIRKADEDNPKGYYEVEKVKKLAENASWLGEARGKAIKIISSLLKYLPEEYQYKIIFMRRNMDEVLKSQSRMLIRRGHESNEENNEKMKGLFSKHLQDIENWLKAQSNIAVMYIHYNEILKEPARNIEKINQFFGSTLDVDKMMDIVDPSLYRQRK